MFGSVGLKGEDRDPFFPLFVPLERDHPADADPIAFLVTEALDGDWGRDARLQNPGVRHAARHVHAEQGEFGVITGDRLELTADDADVTVELFLPLRDCCRLNQFVEAELEDSLLLFRLSQDAGQGRAASQDSEALALGRHLQRIAGTLGHVARGEVLPRFAQDEQKERDGQDHVADRCPRVFVVAVAVVPGLLAVVVPAVRPVVVPAILVVGVSVFVPVGVRMLVPVRMTVGMAVFRDLGRGHRPELPGRLQTATARIKVSARIAVAPTRIGTKKADDDVP